MPTTLSGAFPQAPAKPLKKQPRLLWWHRADDAGLYWASGHGGDYVVTCRNGFWDIEYRRGRRQWRLGTAATLEEAKARAQRNYDRARGVEVRR